MTHTEISNDRTMKYIILLIVLAALLFAEALRAQNTNAQTPNAQSTNAQNPKQSRFSATTLKIGVESFLRDRLEETDEFEIAGEIQEQIFNEQFVVARCDAAEESLAGTTKVSVVFSKNDHTLRRVFIPVRVTLRRQVPVLSRSMQRGLQDLNE